MAGMSVIVVTAARLIDLSAYDTDLIPFSHQRMTRRAATMSRATMYRQPLERYLLNRINNHIPAFIAAIEIRRLDNAHGGCNWDIAVIEPRLPPETINDLNRQIIEPLRASINLAE